MCYNEGANLDNFKQTDNLPLTLEASDIAKLLNISKANAYQLLHSKSFPSVQVGRRLIVPKPAFIKWLENPLYMNLKGE
jgi:excisionase family DNA binding protein